MLPSARGAMRDIALHRSALPVTLFRRLARAVREVGSERMAQSYSTNFWYSPGTSPGNLAEEAIARLWPLARPGARCIGAEWWLGRLPSGESLALHFDRDMALQRREGRVVHPLWSSILSLNRFPGSPPVILDQRLDRDGRSLVPAVPAAGKSISPEPNLYAVYRGDLY